MRCVEILQSALDRDLSSIHSRRVAALWRVVVALIIGGKASLTELGRSLPGETSDKHKIKAVDQFLGNVALHSELDQIYRAVAHWLLKDVPTPVVAVDWTGAGAHHYELTAKICSDGRALPLYSRVYRKHLFCQSIAHKEFLQALASILPRGCKPIVITDAGYHAAWFFEVRRQNWHYIGRVRGTANVYLNDRCFKMQDLHQLAGTRPIDLGEASVSDIDHRLVLSAKPRGKKRTRLTRKGTRGRKTVDRKASKSASEPWVLATSLRSDAAFVVHAYSLRMQVEEAIRDRKSHRHGWSMHLTITRSSARLSVLLMVASLAAIAVQFVGRAVSLTAQSYGYQANTTRKRRVLSYFFLGCRAARRDLDLTGSQLRHAVTELIESIKINARPFASKLPKPARYRQSEMSGQIAT